ncbi:MAG: AAA family ATPase [Syntrophaceae bacterium]|nr:AAA family ATPase [Syntrophaceae bacterium]
MDYFRILHLKREPFSNSPEPDFFFESDQHLGCLQRLELSIRLRRGLNVVIGDVGTGKTTLCRRMIQRLGSSDEDRGRIATHLILDPDFGSAIECLTTISESFGLGIPERPVTEWQLRENIKNYLYQQGVDGGKITVLIIDEGQKLSSTSIEILREFLNYETNEFKLLQIVIFAQSEFEEILKNHPNFTDRINLLYRLQPLRFRQTQAMVTFRIARASGQDGIPKLFTRPALWAVHFATGGFPRKIITLCHEVLLALIIQNRAKADSSLVWACAKRLAMYDRFRGKTLKVAFAVLMLLIVGGLLIQAPDLVRTFGVDAKKQSIARIPEVSQPAQAVVAVNPPVKAVASEASRQPPAEKLVEAAKIPVTLGRIAISQGGTVWWILSDVYGQWNLGIYQAFQKANPDIENLNRVPAGKVLQFPAVQAANPTANKGVWVQIASGHTLDEAYRILRDRQKQITDLKMLAYWNSREGTVFSVVSGEHFIDEASAIIYIRKLPPSIRSGVKVLNGKWESDTVFFSQL